ncbi:hypothetical protein BDR06DRAFT_969316 [Suillus hirtellus]|nr:hypothetical protein BDR06DRAFT_969316 [Suillus hirtellus]
MAPQLTIIPGIRLLHVHGRQDSCYVRYASNFIEGIGWINGEIMEMLWARLNLISPAAQGMTLCRKYKLARNDILESGKAFDRLDEAAPSHLKTEWLARERIAQSSRLNDSSAMDEYEINIKKGQRLGLKQRLSQPKREDSSCSKTLEHSKSVVRHDINIIFGIIQ